MAHPVHEFAQACARLGRGIAGMPQIVNVDVGEPGRRKRGAPCARETTAADLGGPVTRAPLASSATAASTRRRPVGAKEIGGDVNVLAAECGQLAPAQTAEDREEDEQPVPAIGERVGQAEDLAQCRHRALRGFLLTGAFDPARVTAAVGLRGGAGEALRLLE